MTDIDTIREIIKELDGSFDGGPGKPRNGTIVALSALERVSALQADMEVAMEAILNEEGKDVKLPWPLYEKLMKCLQSARLPKESR